MKTSFFAGLTLAVVLAGCLDGTPDGEDPGVVSPTTGDVSLQSSLELEGCSFWWGTVDVPPPLSPGRPPPGFEEPAQALAITLRVLRFDCENITVLDLDRGPITLLLELHNNIVPTEECRSTANRTGYWVAHTLLASDEGVLNATHTLGLPSYAANLERFSELSGSADAMVDRWSAEGYPESEVRVERDEFSNRFSPAPHRIFWSDGETLWVGDMTWEGAGSAGSRRALAGSFAEPMLLSEVSDPIAMGSFWFTDATASLSIKEYPSGACEGSS